MKEGVEKGFYLGLFVIPSKEGVEKGHSLALFVFPVKESVAKSHFLALFVIPSKEGVEKGFYLGLFVISVKTGIYVPLQFRGVIGPRLREGDEASRELRTFSTPSEAGIQQVTSLDSRLRGNDGRRLKSRETCVES